jgi:hypothetical protein
VNQVELAQRFADEYLKCADLVRTGSEDERVRARQRRISILRAVGEAKCNREFNGILSGDATREVEA